MTKSFFLKQLDDILTEYNLLKARAEHSDFSGKTPIEDITTLISKSKAAISRIVGIKSEYYKDVDAILKQTNIGTGLKLKNIIGSVLALRSDLQNDYLKSLSDIIQSEVFSDYIEMSEHLLNEGYKDPAAVLVGSTLEVHLRELCISNGIALEVTNSNNKLIPKKADTMNSDLAKEGIYTSVYQKQIIAWLGLRNSAAHGKYNEYTKEEISLMLQGVRQFILTTR